MKKLIAFAIGAYLVCIIAPVFAQSGTATLNWLPATMYEDGSPLLIQEQRIYRSMVQGQCATDPVPCTPIDSVSGGISAYIDGGLFNGTYYYTMTTVDQFGAESVPSNEASITINIGGNIVRPNPPTNLTVN